MTLFTASFETVVLRFGLMMVTVLGSFLIGLPFLAILALPIFLSAMMAVTFTPKTKIAKVYLISNDKESIVAA